MKYIEEMNSLIDNYRTKFIMEEIVRDRLNKCFNKYLNEIESDYEEASSVNRIRVFKALKRGLKNEC